MKQQISLEIKKFVELLFKFEPVTRSTWAHKKFVEEMVTGILGSRSTLIANIARFLNEPCPLIATEQRLCTMLMSAHLPWNDLSIRATDLGSQGVKKDDIIAFDPGDVTKKYAKKMDYLYPVHDGSSGKIALGWEDFSVEAIHWEDGKKVHIPLFERLINASCPEYVSQNHQIIEAIKRVHQQLGDNCGVWTFDRGHDRGIIFKFLLTLNLLWIVRLKFNRNLRFVDGEVTIKLKDFIEILKYEKKSWWLLFPKQSGELRVAWRKVRLPSIKTELTLVIVHDFRNEKPVMFLTNLVVNDDLSAMIAFGYYLERWGKEEGYRFCKSYLNLENLRTLRWPAIENLARLVQISYLFISWYHRRHQEKLETMCDQELKTFKKIDTVRFRYYRIGQMIQKLLWQASGLNPGALSMTEVG